MARLKQRGGVLVLSSSIRKGVRHCAHRIFPYRFPSGCKLDPGAAHWVTFALQRAGQHVVINWVCAHLHDVLHLNHVDFFRRGRHYVVTPTLGSVVQYVGGERNAQVRPGPEAVEPFLARSPSTPNLLCSFEDWSLTEPMPRRLVRDTGARVLVILRDPYNWLASSMAHGHNSAVDLERKAAILREYLEQALGRVRPCFPGAVYIDFNRFIASLEYRHELAATLGFAFSPEADAALSQVLDFGKGSSFDRLNAPEGGPRVFERWRHYAEDPGYLRLLRSQPLSELAEAYFGLADPLAAAGDLAGR